MTFKKWADQYDWWKSGTRDSFKRAWDKLIGAAMRPDDAGALLDDLMVAMRDEYGD